MVGRAATTSIGQVPFLHNHRMIQEDNDCARCSTATVELLLQGAFFVIN